HGQDHEDAEECDRDAEDAGARAYPSGRHGEAVRRRRRQSATAGGPNTTNSAASAATVAKSIGTEGPPWGSATDARLETISPFGSVEVSALPSWSPELVASVPGPAAASVLPAPVAAAVPETALVGGATAMGSGGS